MDMKTKVIKKEEFDIGMFKNILVGDPQYFEEYTGAKLDSLVYTKSVRGKENWVGKAVVSESEIEFEEFDTPSIDNRVVLYFAENQNVLKTLLKGNLAKGEVIYPKECKIKTKELGLDSAQFDFSVNNEFICVSTGSDGSFGLIIEVLKGTKLVGLIMDIYCGITEYDEMINNVKYLFKLK